MEWLENIVDESLRKMECEEVLMKRPDPNMPSQMINDKIPRADDWIGWKPIKSEVTDEELHSLESTIGIEFPKSFKYLLKYKHYYSLVLKDKAIHLISNIPERTLQGLELGLLENWYPKNLIELGYIYFAEFHDYGLLCFDSNFKEDDNEFPIVYFNQEDLSQAHPYAENFRDLLESEPDRSNKFIEKMNELYS